MTETIQRRAVFFIGGYDPKSPDAFFTRLEREAARSGKVGNFSVACDGEMQRQEHYSRQSYVASGEGWTARTVFNFVHLDDIVLADFNRPLPVRLWRYVVTVSDYLFTGPATAFFRHAWRFGLYFLYPLVMLLIALALTWLAARFASSFGSIAAILAASATFALVVQFVFKRWFVLHLMDLWSFSRDFARTARTDIEVKLDTVAQEAANVLTSGDYDEVLFVGHSTGGALALSLAARAREKAGDIPAATKPVILTVGSTALKIGLYRKASTFRAQVAMLVIDPAWEWAEYQALTDIINFDKTNPAALMAESRYNQPVINRIRMKEMVDGATYTRMKGNFFRMHYQFVFGNSKPYHYDFPAIVFGPSSLMERARHPERFGRKADSTT